MAENKQDDLNTFSNGWCGKILRVDLSSETVTELDTQPYAQRFLGGRGIATRLYWEHVPAHAGAFDPVNHLIFMTGPLTATGAQGASRFEIVGKSPMLMPEGFCYGNMGGYWGPALKRAGFDGLIISGKANRSVYLFISGGNATKVRRLVSNAVWTARCGPLTVQNQIKRWLESVRPCLSTTHG